MTNSQLHPIVQDYCNSEGTMNEVLKGHAHDTPVTRALWCFNEVEMKIRPPEEAIAIAETVTAKKVDLDLYILFLTTWANLSAIINRLTEAAALIKRGKALFSQNTSPVIKASILTAEGWLSSLSGNHVLLEESLKKTLESVPRSFARRNMWCASLALLQAQQGRMIDSAQELPNIRRRPINYLIEFIDLVEKGC